MPSYTADETARIVEALKVLGTKGFPVPPEIFDAWCGACITTPTELAVLRRSEKREPLVLMIHRKDKFFHGWHIPGTIMLPGDTEEGALARLVEKEVGSPLPPPMFVDRVHAPKGTPRGQAAALLFVTFFPDGTPVEDRSFFPLFAPPEDTLPHHKKLLARVAEWWRERYR